MRKRQIGFLVIVAVIILVIIILTRSSNGTSKETAMCIADKSIIYTQLGCHACEIQEKLFGDNYKYLNRIDCFYEREECSDSNIQYTPTWIIKGEKYIGVQSIEKLKELTEC